MKTPTTIPFNSVFRNLTLSLATGIALISGLGTTRVSAQSTYETNITTSTWSENFDEISTTALAQIPGGWVFAQGDFLPVYSAPLNAPTSTSSSPDFRLLSADANSQLTTAERDNTVGSTSTVGGRMNFGDATTGNTNRAIGFASSSSSWISPTNFLMFGFTNSNPKAVTNMVLNYHIKRYSRGTYTAAMVMFYYSYDGMNWTHVSVGDVGPFTPSASGNEFLYATGPDVSNVVVTVNSLNVPVNSPFYLAWQFNVAGSTGANCHRIAMDDFSMTLGLGTPLVPPTTYTWPSAAGGWSTAANWQGSILPASPANLVFTGSGGNMTNNLNAVSTGTGSIGYLYYSPSASGSYTLSGNGLTLAAGLTNDSSSAQTINVPLVITADNNFAADNGALNFGGSISNGGNNLSFIGNQNITVSGSISGAGDTIMGSAGTLNLNASNSYAGATTINTGTLQVGNAAAIPPTSTVTVAGGANLNLIGAQSIGALNGAGNVNLANGGTLTISPASSFSGNFSGVIGGNAGFTVAGTGTQSFQGTNTYTGTTTISNGTLNIFAAAFVSVGNGPLVLAGGTLQCNGTRDVTNGVLGNPLVITASSTINNTASATGTGANRYLPFNSTVTTTPSATLTIKNISTGNFSNNMNLRLMGSGFNFSSPIVFDNSAAAHQTNESCQLDSYNTNGTTQTYSGVISGPGILRRGSFGSIVGGGGITILTAQNTYSGEPLSDWAPHCTYLANGLIGFGSSSVTNGSGTILSGPIGVGDLHISGGDAYNGFFASGGAQTVANYIGFSGSTNIGDANTLLITGTNKLTMTGTFDIGSTQIKTLLVSNTASTVFSGAITNTASIIKDGPGTLVFSGINTYGTSVTTNFGTQIAAGTLEVDTVGSSGVGANALVLGATGTLSGSGVVGGATAGNGTVSPGPGRATLTFTNGLDLSSGGTYVWELGANSTNNAGTDFDQVVLNGGSLSLGAGTKLSINFAGTATAPNSTNVFWQQSRSWKVVGLSGTAANPGNTTFGTILNGTYGAGYFTNKTDAGGNIILSFVSTAVPKPVVSGATISGNSFLINFTGSASDTPATFYVVSSTNAAGPYTVLAPAASISQVNSGVFKATIPLSSVGNRFFRIGR